MRLRGWPASVGVALAAATLGTLAVAPADRAATATGMNSTFRQVGVASGVAGLGAIFDHALGDVETVRALSAGTSPLVSAAVQDAYGVALDRVFLTGSAIAAAGALLAFVLVRGGGPTPAASGPDTPVASLVEGAR